MSLTTTVTVARALTGLELARPGECRCQGCRTQLRDGHRVVAYASRPAERDRWAVPRVYCPDCAPATIQAPTLATEEVLVGAFLGVRSTAAGQRHRLVLTGVDVQADSGLDDGAPA